MTHFKKPDWFDAVYEDTLKKTKGKPAWRRNPKINKALQELESEKNGSKKNKKTDS